METILIVDDNKDMRFNLSNILKDEGYEVIAAGDGKRAIKEVKTKHPNLVLLDIRLPGMDGIKTLEEIKKIDNDLAIIMLTAYVDVKDAVRAMKSGAFDYITKPFDNEELVIVIKRALKTQHLSREVEILKKRLGDKTDIDKAMGESPQIKQVLKQVEIIAPTNMTVILQGLSGTGKELIANMIHQKSPRRDEPFIAIDSGAIPETLVESELFGYEKGAFTGADTQKEGKFEQADGGTLFLDEITNLSDTIQMKLLRVIEERKLQHLGGKKDTKIDVRIIVATNTNLYEAVKKGKFRDDLFHRLNEFYINLPPLRERKEDIPVLVKSFLEEANLDLKKKIKKISPEAMKTILTYPWPGNVRELKNAIKRAVLVAKDSILPENLFLETEALNPQVANYEPIIASVDTARNNVLNETNHFRATTRKIKEETERGLLENALRQAEGNKKKAARILGIERSVLYYKMKKLGIGND